MIFILCLAQWLHYSISYKEKLANKLFSISRVTGCVLTLSEAASLNCSNPMIGLFWAEHLEHQLALSGLPEFARKTSQSGPLSVVLGLILQNLHLLNHTIKYLLFLRNQHCLVNDSAAITFGGSLMKVKFCTGKKSSSIF